MRFEKLATVVNSFTEDGLRPIQLQSHIRIVGPVAWEHEYDRAIGGLVHAGEDSPVIPRLQCSNCGFGVAANHHAAKRKVPPTHLQRICDIRQSEVRVCFQVLRQVGGRGLQGCSGPG